MNARTNISFNRCTNISFNMRTIISVYSAKLQKIAVIFAGNRKFNAIRLDY